MNTSTTRIVLALVAGTMIAGCKKYDDGPAFSLRSREERVANTWRVEKAMNGSDDVTSAFDQYELTLTKDKDATLSAFYSLGDLNFEYQTTGSWSLDNKDEDLRLDFENDAADETYQILRLKENELWLQEKGGSLELHLEPR